MDKANAHRSDTFPNKERERTETSWDVNERTGFGAAKDLMYEGQPNIMMVTKALPDGLFGELAES